MDGRVDSGAMAYVLKIRYADTLRRLIVKPLRGTGGINLSYDELEGKIRNLFAISSFVQLVLTYKDREDDVVTISQDEDLEDALVIQGLNPLRIDVCNREDRSIENGDRKEAGGKREPRFSPVADTPLFFNELQKTLLPTIDFLKNIASGQLNHISEKLDQDGKFGAKLLTDVLQAFAKEESKDFKVNPDSRDRGFEFANKGASSSSGPFSDPAADFSQSARAQAAPSPFPGHEKYHTDGVFHHGVKCDRCGVVPIVGPRYKSNKKEDYDLCVSCLNDSQASEADYSRYDQPIKLHGCRNYGAFHGKKMPRCPYFQPNIFGRPACHNRGGLNGSYGRYDPRAFNHNNAFGKLDCRFVRDVTIFDGTELPPGTSFTKIWRLRNSGSLPWPQNMQLVHVGGDELGSVPVASVELPEGGLLPDGEIEVSVDLTAPENPGRYISHWRLMAPSGVKFGHRVWVSLQVVSNNEQSPQILESLIADTEKNQRAMNDGDREDTDDEEKEVAGADFEKAIEGESAGNSSSLNAFFDVNVDVLSAPVIDMVPAGEYRKIQDDDETFSPENYVNENLNLENSELGAFSLLNISEAITVDVPTTSKAPSQLSSEASSFETELLFAGRKVESIVKPEPSASKEEVLLNQLAAMGFTERSLNLELLEHNDYNLQIVLDELFSAVEWDPLLDELQEMGFTDINLNRRLMFKNKGSLRDVVKELVQMYKESVGKNKENV